MELNNVDEQLIAELNSLPKDFWSFRSTRFGESIHGIHKYPAVMIYPIPHHIIRIIKKYQSINSILDPFQGSGTVIVESQRHNINRIFGNDLNPLSILLTKTKTESHKIIDIDLKTNELRKKVAASFKQYHHVFKKLDEYILSNDIDVSDKNKWGNNAPSILKTFFLENNIQFNVPEFNKVGLWFKPVVMVKLQLLKNIINDESDNLFKNFLNVAFSECIRLVSNRRNNVFKLHRMPTSEIIKFDPDVFNIFFKILNSNILLLNDFKLGVADKTSVIKIYNEDARLLDNIQDDSIDLMITSPPYGDSQTTVAYGQFSQLTLDWLGFENSNMLDSKLLGGSKITRESLEINSSTLNNVIKQIEIIDKKRANEVFDFYIDLKSTLKNISLKMKKNSYQFWVTGNRNVRGLKIPTDVILEEMATDLGLSFIYKTERHISNKVIPSKINLTSQNKMIDTMSKEHIIVFRKN